MSHNKLTATYSDLVTAFGTPWEFTQGNVDVEFSSLMGFVIYSYKQGPRFTGTPIEEVTEWYAKCENDSLDAFIAEKLGLIASTTVLNVSATR